MKKLRVVIKYIALGSVLLFPNTIFSQQNNVDSLKKCLLIQKKDSNKVNIYFQLAKSFERSNPPVGAIFADSALVLARDIDFEKGIDKSLLELGICYYMGSNFDTALIYTNELLRTRK